MPAKRSRPAKAKAPPKKRAPATKKLAPKKAVSTKTKSKTFTGPVLLAHSYFRNDGKPVIPDPKGWWQSEKLDGFRAVWSGEKFLSRNKNEFVAPQWFKDIMPKSIPMDGELWMGRGKFGECGALRHKVPVDSAWAKVQYNVFDLPTSPAPFEERKDQIEVLTHQLVDEARNLVRAKYPEIWKMLPKKWTPLKAVAHKKVQNKEQVIKDLNAMVAKGGEGLVLRKPGSHYEGKRSTTCLKVKKTFDAECRIVGYKPGTGKYKGKLGSFECVLVKKPAIKFNLSGMDDAIRTNYRTTHPVGTVVTFSYNETTQDGVPRFPRYVRIRKRE